MCVHTSGFESLIGRVVGARHFILGGQADVVFDHQDSLNVSHWGNLAARADVRDTVAFNACMLDSAVAKRVSTVGEAYGRTIKLTGTPTILVNGWKLPGLVRTAALDSMITALLQDGHLR